MLPENGEDGSCSIYHLEDAEALLPMFSDHRAKGAPSENIVENSQVTWRIAKWAT